MTSNDFMAGSVRPTARMRKLRNIKIISGKMPEKSHSVNSMI